MTKQKEKKGKKDIQTTAAICPYIAKKSTSDRIYTICTGTSVSFDIGKIINGQPRHP